MSRILACLTLVSTLALNAVAGIATDVRVVELMRDKDIAHSVFVKVSASPTGVPACNSNSSGWNFVVYDDGQAGKDMLAMLITAQATGQNVTIYGENACENETEKLKRIHLR